MTSEEEEKKNWIFAYIAVEVRCFSNLNAKDKLQGPMNILTMKMRIAYCLFSSTPSSFSLVNNVFMYFFKNLREKYTVRECVLKHLCRKWKPSSSTLWRFATLRLILRYERYRQEDKDMAAHYLAPRYLTMELCPCDEFGWKVAQM